MHSKDERMKHIDEMLMGIKQIKCNQMEEFFEERVELKREKELKTLKKQ